jgi:hypothetical protein
LDLRGENGRRSGKGVLLQVVVEAHPFVQMEADDRGALLQFDEVTGQPVDALLVGRLEIPGKKLSCEPICEHDLLLRVRRLRRRVGTEGRNYVKCRHLTVTAGSALVQRV